MIRFPFQPAAACLALALVLAACTSVESFVSGEKIEYRNARAREKPLEVPPDLTQLGVDPRYAPQAGAISAATLQAPGAASAPTSTALVAPEAVGDFRIERLDKVRWLSTPLTAEQLWPQLEAFWQERGLTLVINQADAGVMETDWAENRANLPQDFVRKTIGKVFDSLFSTGELDRYRTRVERSDRGTDIYIVHRGMEEFYTTRDKDQTSWRPRPSDPLLENEMLMRLMVKLGVKDQTAKAAITQAAAASAVGTSSGRARVLSDRAAATLQVDESYDRAWRRVGLSLDRSGFTVEDRDRSQGLYFVRYVDPAQAGKEEPGFFSKLFGTGDKFSGPVRYRVSVKAEGNTSTVSVLDAKGAPENGDAGQRIIKLLVDDLK